MKCVHVLTTHPSKPNIVSCLGKYAFLAFPQLSMEKEVRQWIILREPVFAIRNRIIIININKHLTTGPKGNSEFCFLKISVFPEMTLRFEGNKVHCSPSDQSLSDLLYSKANGSNRWKKNSYVIDKWRATAVNISWVMSVNCFLFDITVFAMLLMAFGGKQFQCYNVYVMGQWTSQWIGAREKNTSYIHVTKSFIYLLFINLFFIYFLLRVITLTR